MLWAELAKLFVPLAICLLLVSLSFGFRRTKARESSPEGPVDELYKIYTTEFDVAIKGEDVADRLMSLSRDFADGCFHTSKDSWNVQILASERLAKSKNKRKLKPRLNLDDYAIFVLLDQSGSMKGYPMAWAASEVRELADVLAKAGGNVQVAGFSTAGWRGGFARQKWVANKQPKRPGRLCALLHVIYRSFDEEEWNEPSWRAMLNPNILRENVDGEAILWAEAELKRRPETRKILFTISDGAPVDDSTLMENGDRYLWRHWQKVVLNIEALGEIELLAIGIDHRVTECYSRSAMIKAGDDMVKTAWNLLSE